MSFNIKSPDLIIIYRFSFYLAIYLSRNQMVIVFAHFDQAVPSTQDGSHSKTILFSDRTVKAFFEDKPIGSHLGCCVCRITLNRNRLLGTVWFKLM